MDERQGTNGVKVKDISLVDAPGPVQFLVAQLEVDVGMPGLLLGFPLHPALKHLAAAWACTR